jgi:hypothetical protein
MCFSALASCAVLRACLSPADAASTVAHMLFGMYARTESKNWITTTYYSMSMYGADDEHAKQSRYTAQATLPLEMLLPNWALLICTNHNLFTENLLEPAFRR